MADQTRTLCPYCGVGCGLIATTGSGRLLEVAGDPDHPVNRGRTCRKPRELPSAVHARDRARTPLLRDRRDVRFRSASWEQALAGLSQQLLAIRERHGPESIAFYISGQLLTEDYYVINKLAKGFLGTNNVDSNSRLCMSSAVAAYNGAFGSDGPPPSYADIEEADCLLLLGSNAAACHPILWGRVSERRRQGAFVICADPRATPTARGSDLHLPVLPGCDLPLLNAMLHAIVRDGLVDEPFVRAHTTGFEAAAALAAEWPPERAATVCGVPAADIELAARRFATAPRAMALWSMGANQSTVGTLKNRALINLCLATGNIGRAGCGPLSLTGQPNAMGGRETGGLAHLLPGYRSVTSAADRAEMERLWRCPPISSEPGLPAVELFDALAEGRVKAVWIVATNPAVSMPDAARARRALERAELVVVQDAYHPTETSALAHAVLPAAAWPEKRGTMTNSERRVGLVQAALPPPSEARADWRIFASLAAALGYGEAFAWEDEAAVFDEFVTCTAGRPCDLTGLSHARLQRVGGGVQWPAGSAARLYGELRFRTDDGRARFVATPHSGPADSPDHRYPLTLTTGRVAEHWHTMTRTAKSPALNGAAPEPLLELHPDDAAAAGVADGDQARVRSVRGEVVLKVSVRTAVQRGVAFAPMHWGALHAPAGAGTVNAVANDAVDPVSHQPELKAAAVRVEPVAAHTARPVRRAWPRRLVVVGAGMAALAAVEEVLARTGTGTRTGRWAITMLGDEPEPAYNRIMLSKLLARECGRAELELRPPAWYASRGVAIHTSHAAAALDLDGHVVLDEHGGRHPYDALLLATGSRPVVPSIDGAELPHVHRFRTLQDAAEIVAAAVPEMPAVVLGGGLLGLEAAAGLRARGMHVTVVELADRVMPQQLDAGGARALALSLVRLGLDVIVGRAAVTIDGAAVKLDDGCRLPAAVVVVAAGVRPETALASAAGIEVGRGVLVDDELRSSAPGVWAVGECAEHNGTVHGLWAPIAEQARVAAASIVGDPAAFLGATPATTLKVAGVELFAGGTVVAAAGQDEIVFSDTRRRIYQKLVLDGDRLAGATLVGDATLGRTLSELLRSGAPVPQALLAPTASAVPRVADALVCSCNAVSRGTITAAINAGGLRTVAEIAQATRAGTGCGSCVPDIAALLGSSDRNTSGTGAKPAADTMAA